MLQRKETCAKMNAKLTRIQAYKAMYVFLDWIWERDYSGGIKGPGDLSSMLGSMSLLADGTTADPSYLKRWDSALKSLGNGEPANDRKQEELINDSITQDHAFNAMCIFIDRIREETNSSELLGILGELGKSTEDVKPEDNVLFKWQTSVNDTLNKDPNIELKFV